jgi:hypothetical protein
MNETALQQDFVSLRDTYPNIYVIVSPPRCSSTAFSRVFWEQPSIRYYSHEPFEVTYYDGQGLDEVIDKLQHPLDLHSVKANGGHPDGRSLVIKEMPYQVGDHFPILAALATGPIVFLMRDPRLNIASRIEKKLETGDSPKYPFIESGWELLSSQIGYCRDNGIEHLLVDSADFRDRPQVVFPRIMERFGLPFTSDSLTWQPTDIEIDNLDGKHRHLYRRVLESTGIQPAVEAIPPLAIFPEEGGWREHVANCLAIYEELGRSEARIVPHLTT